MSFNHSSKNRYKIPGQSIYPSQILNSNSRFQSIHTQSPLQYSQKSTKFIGSTILERYSQTLQHEVQQSQHHKNIQKQAQRQKAIEKFIQQRRSNANLLEELSSLKVQLKNQILEKQYQVIKKERALKMKTLQDQHQNLSAMVQLPYMHQIPVSHSNYPPQTHHSYHLAMPSHKNYKNAIKQCSLIQKNQPKYGNGNNQTRRKSFFSQSKETIIKSAKDPSSEKDRNTIMGRKLPKINYSKIMKGFDRYKNGKSYLNKLKRCFLAVYFVKCLEKNYLKAISERNKSFGKFWPGEFGKFEEDFKDYFYQRFQIFLKLLHDKSYYPLDPSAGDIPELKDQKRKTMMKLVEVFFSCFKDFKNIKVLGKVAWVLCSHMSFVENGVLTLNQLELVCFDPKHRYLRMDKYLEKSQIVGLIFIKTLMFQTLLHPWLKWPKYFDQQNDILVANMRLLGSVLYNLLIVVQDEYLDASNSKKYQLDNFEELYEIKKGVKIELADQLLFETRTKDGEMIGGLYGVEELKRRNISIKKMGSELEEIRETVEKIQQMSWKYKQEFRKKVNLNIEKADNIY